MKKALLGGVAIAALAATAWASTGVYTGLRAEGALRDLTAPPGSGDTRAWQIRDATHQRGLFQSTGRFSVMNAPRCGTPGSDDQGVRVTVSYTLHHLPAPGRAARFQWQVTPEGEMTEAFKTLFGSTAALGGQGTVNLAGAMRGNMTLPAVAVRRAGEVLDISPASGVFQKNDQQWSLQWTIDRAVIRGKGEALEMEGIVMDLGQGPDATGKAGKEGKGSTGSARIQVAQASARQGSLEGLELSVEVREKGDRLDWSATQSVRKLDGADEVLSDLKIQWALNGLHKASAQELGRLLEQQCGLDALTARESRRAANALETLLVRGFSFGVPTLSGRTASASLQGSLLVELTAASGDTASLTEQLRSSGKIAITGSMVSAEQRDRVVAEGLAVVQGDQLSASYAFRQGLFTVNGLPRDATAVEAMLARADEKLRDTLAMLRSPSTADSADRAPPK